MSNSHGESLHEYITNNGITNIKSEYIRDDKRAINVGTESKEMNKR